MSNLKEHLITAPDTQLDQAMREYIKEHWKNEPTALEILEVLDKCVHFALASGLVVMILETMLQTAMKNEHTSMPELEARATWRAEWS